MDLSLLVAKDDPLHLNEILDVITMTSSIGMLFLTAGSLFYVITSKNRIIAFSNILVFVLLIIAFAFESALWTYSSTLFKNDAAEDDAKTIKIRNYLFGG